MPATAVASRRAFATGVAKAPPETFFVGSALFHYLGPAFAVLLFARVDVLGVAWLRIGSAALVFGLWRKPWRGLAHLDRPGWLLLLGLGSVLGVMNSVFYEAIARLPLGTVAAIEFLGRSCSPPRGHAASATPWRCALPSPVSTS